MVPGCPLLLELDLPSLPPRRRAPDSELRSLSRVVGKGSSPASSNASFSHPSLLYRCTVSAAEEGRWLGERRVHKLCKSLLAICKAPAAAGRRRAPSACLSKASPVPPPPPTHTHTIRTVPRRPLGARQTPSRQRSRNYRGAATGATGRVPPLARHRPSGEGQAGAKGSLFPN